MCSMKCNIHREHYKGHNVAKVEVASAISDKVTRTIYASLPSSRMADKELRISVLSVKMTDETVDAIEIRDWVKVPKGIDAGVEWTASSGILVDPEDLDQLIETLQFIRNVRNGGDDAGEDA